MWNYNRTPPRFFMECIGMNFYDSQAGPTTDLVPTLEENSLCSVSANNLHQLQKQKIEVHNFVLLHILRHVPTLPNTSNSAHE